MKKNKLKKISSRICGGGLLFLSNISLISIGFSAWTIGGATNAEAEIKVSVDDLIDLQNIFQIQQPQMFQYGPYGIIRDETFVSDGYIYFPILINTSDENFKDLLSTDNTLYFTFEISNTGTFGLFNDSYLEKSDDGSYNAFYSINTNSYSNECTDSTACSVSNQTAISNFTIKNTNNIFDSASVYFNMRLGFSFSDFGTAVYPKLSTSGLSFSINVKAVTA